LETRIKTVKRKKLTYKNRGKGKEVYFADQVKSHAVRKCPKKENASISVEALAERRVNKKEKALHLESEKLKKRTGGSVSRGGKDVSRLGDQPESRPIAHARGGKKELKFVQPGVKKEGRLTVKRT